MTSKPKCDRNVAYVANRHALFVTGSGKTRLLEQAKILVINVPNDRAKNRLRNDMLISVHIPSSIPELCALETRSREKEVLRKRPSKIAQ